MPAENTALIVLLFVFILFVLLFCVGASRLNRRRYAQKEVSSAKGEQKYAWICGKEIIDSGSKDCHHKDAPPQKGCECHVITPHKDHVEDANKDKNKDNQREKIARKVIQTAQNTIDTANTLMRSYNEQGGGRAKFELTLGSAAAAPSASAVAGPSQYAAIDKETKDISQKASHETL